MCCIVAIGDFILFQQEDAHDLVVCHIVIFVVVDHGEGGREKSTETRGSRKEKHWERRGE